MILELLLDQVTEVAGVGIAQENRRAVPGGQQRAVPMPTDTPAGVE
jgi:hypothetical protein